MRVTVLVENTTLIDRYLRGEPALALLVEDDDAKVLFDTGYSDLLVGNAAALGISLLDLTHVVLSHGHVDHTGGLGPLLRHWTSASIEGIPWRRPVFVAHPLAFRGRSSSSSGVGSWVSPDILARYGEVRLSVEPLYLAERILFLGEIPDRLPFEAPAPGADAFPDDTGLALATPDGLVILSGCAHAGICSTIAHARRIADAGRVRDVVGGFHMLGPSDHRLAATASFLTGLGLPAIHPCHCTDFPTRCALARTIPVGAIGVGAVLDYD